MNSKIEANFLSSLGSSDYESWLLVQRAYKNHAWGEEIFETGFNMSSGYVYIALENGVQICSCFGQDVEYCVFDFESGEEHFYNTYEDALNHEA